MTKQILVVSPFSGRGVGGGLAVMNQELTKALADEGHVVKLLTMELAHYPLDPKEHGAAEIVLVKNEMGAHFQNLKADDSQRNALYDLINSDETILKGRVADSKNPERTIAAKFAEDHFVPDIIIGHSRFSGPAAVKLKKNLFPKATVEYFLHSYPIEGSILVGHQAYDEPISNDLAGVKLEQEREWMTQADVAVGVGPLLRYGAALILGNKLGNPCRVHECIPGTTFDNAPVQSPLNGPVQLLMSGRANVPIKGFEDVLLAVLKLRQKKVLNFLIRVRGWESKTYNKGQQNERVVTAANVQEWANDLLGLGPEDASVVQVLPMTSDANELRDEIRQSFAVLMPSYAEHFGLVPFDAFGLGVPCLMSEFSGAGMFLDDPARFGTLASDLIVRDFGNANKPRPLKGTDFLANVAPDAFDRRPEAWADAIEGLINDPGKRFAAAAEIRRRLQLYTWQNCAQALVGAASFFGRHVSKQGPSGSVLYEDAVA